MPIRMVDDPKGPKRNTGNNARRGGTNPLLAILPFLFKFLLKKPKILIPLLLIAGVVYFFGGFDSCMGPVEQTDSSSENLSLSTGLEMSPEMYAKSEIFAPLASNYKNVMPSKVSLRKYCPPIQNQGSQGSCVGWASSYAARTILHSRATGLPPTRAAFSPASLYNQIKLPNCQGAYIHNAMDVMQTKGVLPWNEFGYNENDCNRQLSRDQYAMASKFTTRGFQRLWDKPARSDVDVEAIKQNLAQGAPVVIGMMVGNTFMQGMQGRADYRPSRGDYNMRGFGGHAMCVVGYDDTRNGGSFEIMNSWGKQWGENGYGWVRYDDFRHFTKEAYGLYPMGNAVKQDPTKLAVKFGLLENTQKRNIVLREKSPYVFETKGKVPKGTRFKVEVSNSIECYVYVFGEETDGSSYVLFPYTAKHSAYCGITGTRVFPRDQSMMVDDLGNRDRIAVLVTKKPIDFIAKNKEINAASGNYAQKVYSVFKDQMIPNVRFQPGEVISLEAPVGNKNAVMMILEIVK
jgi:C1A family cysteine protease